MLEKRKKEESYEIVDATGKTHIKLDIFLRAFMQKLMGVSLDNGRMSINTDRQFAQFEKTTKDKFYQFTDDSIKYLTVRGVISHGNKSNEKSQEMDH